MSRNPRYRHRVGRLRLLALGPEAIGERLALPVHNRVGRVLLAQGTVLNERLIERLADHGYQSVPVSDPLAPDVLPNETVRAELRAEAVETIAHCMDESAAGGRVQLPRNVRSVVDGILDSILRNGEVAMCCAALRSLENYTFIHSVNVCIYSVLVGTGLALDRTDMRHLGLGALLHDIGKIYYMDLVQKLGPLTPQERSRIERHTTDGYEMLRRCHDIDLRAAHVAFQHHERLDGSGYPRGLKGSEIHPWAAAVAIADVYDTITSDRAYGRAQPPHVALGELRAMAERGLLDRRLVHHFMNRVAAYPDGAILRLQGGEIAVVAGQTPQGPACPHVRILTDTDMHVLPEPTEHDVREGEVRAVLEDYPRAVRAQFQAAAASR